MGSLWVQLLVGKCMLISFALKTGQLSHVHNARAAALVVTRLSNG